ncbi:MAG: hypothetical protein CME64_05495 [Halobacteriovoraceae bacterium]|nr:hypothetical protein [Halobacteriovoraceae bacterium]
MKFLISLTLFTISQLSANIDIDYPSLLKDSEKVEVLWSGYQSGELEALGFYSAISEINLNNLEVRDQLRIAQIKNSFKGEKSSFSIYKLNEAQAMKIASELDEFTKVSMRLGEDVAKSIEKAQAQLSDLAKFQPKSKQQIEDIVFNTPDVADYKNGQYHNGVKLFLFCRHDRSYPCRFVLKDMHDRLVRNSYGELWSLPALAKSAGNLPFYKTNGYTPEGVHTIDSVMPEANRVLSFGKFRRVILNWVPTDADTRKLLPRSNHSSKWWRAASIARNNGRKWLRIHGTGRINKRPSSKYYPHMPTAGCVSVREGSYPGVTYKDQRVILDSLMKAMGLGPVFMNEPKIKGLLYVIELDQKEERVSVETLKEYGIF